MSNVKYLKSAGISVCFVLNCYFFSIKNLSFLHREMVVWSSFGYPESTIKFEEATRVFLDKKDYGVGTLFVSERLETTT